MLNTEEEQWKPPSYASVVEDDNSNDSDWKPPDYAKPVEEKPKERGFFSKVKDFITPSDKLDVTKALPAQIHQFLEEHPTIRQAGQRFLGFTPKEDKARPGYSEVQGPEVMKIPGLEQATDYLSQKITGSEGYGRLAAGALIKGVGGILEGGFDPRTAGIRESSAIEPSLKRPRRLLAGDPAEVKAAEEAQALSQRQPSIKEGVPREFALPSDPDVNANISSKGKNIEDVKFDLAREKFNMGRDLPEEKPNFVNPFEKKPIAEVSKIETWKPPEYASPSEEEPQFARSEQGGIKIGQNIERSAQELTTGYSNPLEGIMVREGMQNAIDAVRHLGEDGKIGVKITDKGMMISDNGKGMTRGELETVFSDLHESGKTSEAGATGGKGIGKATYILGGDRFKAETVVFENGKKIKRTIEGTPAEFSKHVPIKEEVVPLNTPTGTTIQTDFREGQNRYTANSMLQDIKDYTRGIKSKVNINRYGGDEAGTFSQGKFDKTIGSASIEGHDVTIKIPEGEKLEPRSSVEVKYLNNGMYQFRKYHGLSEQTDHMPGNIIVDIHPNAEEGTREYPFPTQRESLKDTIQDKITKMIDDRLAFPEQQTKKMKLKELYASMQPFSKANTVRKSVLFDPGNRLNPSELKTINESPVMNAFSETMDRIVDNILKATGESKWSERLEGVGVVLDPFMHGVHIPNPETGKSTILINPFEHISSSEPEQAALENVITALHETGHIGTDIPMSTAAVTAEELKDPRIGRYLQSYLTQVMAHGGIDMGHGIAFIKRLGQVYADYGPRRAFEEADNLTKIFTDESGGYNREIQKLLQIYNESRGRAAVTEDLLSRTGNKQITPPGGEGNIPPNNKPNGEGIVKSAVDKLLSSLKEASSKVGEQQAINRAERARRFAAFSGVKEEGVVGASKSLGKLKGEFNKVEPGEALGLNKDETDSLFTAVKRANILPGEKARGYTALFKLMNSEAVPVRSELKILDDVFGNGFADQITLMHGGIGAVNMKIGKVANTMKSLMSSVDLSFPLKQGIGMIHKAEWRDAVREQLKYFAKPEYYDAAMKAIEDRPKYLLGRESGLFLAKHDSISSSEEAFMKSYVGDIPKGVKSLYVRNLVDASERAYTGGLNKLRSDLFDNLTELAEKSGNEVFTTEKLKNAKGELMLDEAGNIKTTKTPTQIAENIANYINVFTGRGKLGKLEPIANTLNTYFWSPRLLSSRLTALNPKFYYNLDPFTRKEAIKSLFAIATGSGIINGLGALAGGTVGYNILSADFAKTRFKPSNNVLDPSGGYQQPVVAAARMVAELNRMAEGKKQINNQPGIAGIAGNFMVNKLSPLAGLAYDIASAKQFTGGGDYSDRFGNKKNILNESAKRFVPMFIQDVYSIVQSDPSFTELVGLTPLTALGAGEQNYAEKKPQGQLRLGRSRNLKP